MAEQGCGQPGGSYPTDCELTEALRERARRRSRPVPRSAAWHEALPRARQVRLLLLDVDGVLTDGTITYGTDGIETKSFHTQDGLGLKLLQESGVAAGIITARTSEAVLRRARELGFAHVVQGAADKLAAFEAILRETGLRPPQTAYMGDDWMDLPLLNRVGLAAAPANAVAEVDLTAFDLPVLMPTEDEQAAHAAVLAELDKASGGKTLWRTLAA